MISWSRVVFVGFSTCFGSIGQLRVALNKVLDALLVKTMEGHKTVIDPENPIKSETVNKATATGQEASFLIETELDKLG